MRIVRLATFAILLGSAPASVVSTHAQRLTFERVPEVPQALDIVQDHDGFLWIATLQGLARYDGYSATFLTHIPADSGSVSHSRMQCLYVDREGTLWVGTYGGGLNRYDRQRGAFEHFRREQGNPNSLSQDTVLAIAEDLEGDLWIGTLNGLNRMDRGTGRITRFFHDDADPRSLGGNQVRTIHVDRSGAVWVGTNSVADDPNVSGGLNRFERESATFVRYRLDARDGSSPMANDVRAIHDDTQGNLWVGTWSSDLYVMDRNARTFTEIAYPHHPEWMRQAQIQRNRQFAGVRFVHEDSEGFVWIGVVFEGVFRYDPHTRQIAYYELDRDDPSSLGFNLGDDGVWSMYETREGVLWLGTWGGLYKRYRYQTKLPRYTLDPPGSPGFNATQAFREDGSGRLWIGTRSGGLSTYEHGRGVTARYYHDSADPHSLSSNWVWEIYEDRSGVLWIGTGAGLDRFDGERFHRYRHEPSNTWTIPRGAVSVMLEDRGGSLWIGTEGGGLCRFDRATERCIRYVNEPQNPATLSGNTINVLLEDREGQLWVGTLGNGLNRLDPKSGHVTRFGPVPGDRHGLSDIDITALHEDRHGILWIGTRSGGLNRFDPRSRQFQHFTTRTSDLPDDHILAILGDGANNLWISTTTRLTKFDPTTSLFRTYLHRFAWWTYRAAYKNEAGRFFFGSADGFHAFHPDDLQLDPDPPAVLLTGIELAGAPGDARPAPLLAADAEIRLSHQQNDFTLAFTGIHYGRPELIRYTYRLEPHDTDWRDAGSQRTATYSRVPPGRYTFRVRAANADGIWNEEGASVSVVILPPWWRTWWAYTLYGFIVVLSLLAADRAQRLRITQKQKAEAAIREAELRAQALEADNRRKQAELEKARELEAMNATLLAHEKQLEAQNRRLAEIDQMKSRFFANISHEFRTPLTLILGPVRDALARSAPLDRQHLSLIRRNGESLLRLISQLLDLSRLEAGAMQVSLRRGDVVAFVRRITAAFSSRAERGQVVLTFQADRSEIVVPFDRNKLETICQNLLSNALKFTPAGGAVTVRVEESGGVVEISVSDTGPGIPQEVLPFIFDRFYQVDASATRRHEGTGIGLALVRELAELHGGVVFVRSDVGTGTTFSVRLPVESDGTLPKDPVDDDLPYSAPGDGTAEDATFEPLPSPNRPDVATILIVEDNADVRAYLRSHLAASYRVIEAGDGAEGLQRARLERPDLVIADVMMPQMDGYALCKTIKADPSLDDVPVVLVTARADEESKLEGLEKGADDYLTKPFSAAELLYRVENLIVIRRRLRMRFSREVFLEPGHVVVASEKAVFLERIQEIVEANLGDSAFGVDRLADEMNMSSRQLQRRLKELEQLSPAGYLRMVRLRRSAMMLEQEAGRVKEVAYATGFRDVKHFSTLFRQVFGVPPSEYQRHVQSGST